MRIFEIIVEHGDKWERDSEGKGIGWGFTEWEDEARKYKDAPPRKGTGKGNQAMSATQAAELYGDNLDAAFDKEELEEIKVTKTLAGKRQTPSRDLAMKKKKKSPNQGKPPVEIHKHRGAKELANITLKGEY